MQHAGIYGCTCSIYTQQTRVIFIGCLLTALRYLSSFLNKSNNTCRNDRLNNALCRLRKFPMQRANGINHFAEHPTLLHYHSIIFTLSAFSSSSITTFRLAHRNKRGIPRDFVLLSPEVITILNSAINALMRCDPKWPENGTGILWRLRYIHTKVARFRLLHLYTITIQSAILVYA